MLPSTCAHCLHPVVVVHAQSTPMVHVGRHRTSASRLCRQDESTASAWSMSQYFITSSPTGRALWTVKNTMSPLPLWLARLVQILSCQSAPDSEYKVACKTLARTQTAVEVKWEKYGRHSACVAKLLRSRASAFATARFPTHLPPANFCASNALSFRGSDDSLYAALNVTHCILPSTSYALQIVGV